MGGRWDKRALFTGDSDMSGPKVKLRHSGRHRKHDRPHTAVKGSLVSLEGTRLKGMLSQQDNLSLPHFPKVLMKP